MGTHCQTAAQSGSGERQNLGVHLGPKKGRSQLQTENIIVAVGYILCLYSLHFMKYIVPRRCKIVLFYISLEVHWKTLDRFCK